MIYRGVEVSFRRSLLLGVKKVILEKINNYVKLIEPLYNLKI